MVASHVVEPAAVAQVKHTIQMPAPLWGDFGLECRASGITKSEALRKAIWQWVDQRRRLGIDPGGKGRGAVVARTLCIETVHADGQVTYERLVYGSY